MNDERIATLMAERFSLDREQEITGDQLTVLATYLYWFRTWQTRYQVDQIGIPDLDETSFPATDHAIWGSDSVREMWPLLKLDLNPKFAAFWEERYGYLE